MARWTSEGFDFFLSSVVTQRTNRTTKRISTALRQQQKSIALAHLRFKKSLEDVLTKRLGALQNLEATLMSVETAAGDIEVNVSFSSVTRCVLIVA